MKTTASNGNLSIKPIWKIQHDTANWRCNGNQPNLIHQSLQNVCQYTAY
uniref:Uncharacterized protein n=1 Tax=Setaria italica TaxID=4555 RepID=K3Z1B9_SETIT